METVRESLLHLLHQSPSSAGLSQTRWTLQGVLQATHEWLRLGSVPGMSQLFHRLKLHWKRGRYHVHSPDEQYLLKLRTIKLHLLGAENEKRTFVFVDEFTLYRHPSLACAYEPAGQHQPLAELGYKSNYTWRIAAGLNAYSGQVTYFQARVLDVTRMIRFYRKLQETYPQTEIWVALDNWPLHYHPDVLATLQPQEFPFGLHVPPSWTTIPLRPPPAMRLPVRLLFLPTYASWTNPIEKLWRLLRQDVLHLHRYADNWVDLKQRVWDFLDQFQHGSPDLLRYVGLSDPDQLYRALFPAGTLKADVQ